MQNIFLIFAAVLGVLAFIWGCQSNNELKKNRKEDVTRTSMINRRTDIVKKLETLSKYPIKNTNVLVTCYMRSLSQTDSTGQNYVFYICPVCGSRTKYLKEDLSYDFVVIRRMVSQMRDVEIKLDETSFCKKCQPHSVNPKFSIDITIVGDDKKIHTEYVTIADIRLLINFFNNDFNYIAVDSIQRQESLERLEILLGLSKSDK